MASLTQSKITFNKPPNTKKRKTASAVADMKLEPASVQSVFDCNNNPSSSSSSSSQTSVPQWQIVALDLEKRLKSLQVGGFTEDERYECCSSLVSLCSLVNHELIGQKTKAVDSGKSASTNSSSSSSSSPSKSKSESRKRKRNDSPKQQVHCETEKKEEEENEDVIVTDALSDEMRCECANIRFLSPRGRFHVQFYETHLRLRPQAKVNKNDPSCPETIIPLKAIAHVISVPKIGANEHLVIFNLKNPVAYGKQMLDNIAMQFKSKDKLEITVQKTSSDSSQLSGLAYEIVVELITSVLQLNIPIHKPDAAIFKSSNDKLAIKCYVGVNDGFLYPLEKGILFVTKPMIFIAKKNIVEMRFARGGKDMKSVDLEIEVPNNKVHSFTMIAKEEQETLKRYVIASKMGDRGEDSDATDSEEEEDAHGEDKDGNSSNSDNDDSDYDMEAAEEIQRNKKDMDLMDEYESDDLGSVSESDSDESDGS